MKSLLLLIAAVMTFLTGCSSGEDLSDLEAKMEEIMARPRGRVDPPPEFQRHKTFNYAAHQLRSPFLPPFEEDIPIPVHDEDIVIEPNTERPKEYLERFSIDSLVMVGTITRPGEPIHALMRDPEGTTTAVKVGNYLGRNYGRITEVQEAKISVIEIVPSGTGKWVERPRSVGID